MIGGGACGFPAPERSGEARGDDMVSARRMAPYLWDASPPHNNRKDRSPIILTHSPSEDSPTGTGRSAVPADSASLLK
jgi:hypothetical protein